MLSKLSIKNKLHQKFLAFFPLILENINIPFELNQIRSGFNVSSFSVRDQSWSLDSHHPEPRATKPLYSLVDPAPREPYRSSIHSLVSLSFLHSLSFSVTNILAYRRSFVAKTTWQTNKQTLVLCR